MPALPVNPDDKDLRKYAAAINEMQKGRSNAVGTFTLAANAATTTVTAQNCGSAAVILYMPTTAHASAEIGAGTIYIATVGDGSFVVTHANNAQTDRTYLYVAIG